MALGGPCGGLVVGDPGQIGGGPHRVADAADLQRQGDDLVAPVAGALVTSQPPREPDMRLRRPRGIPCHRRVYAVAPLQQLGHRGDRRSPQAHVPAPRADRDDDVLDRRGAEHPHRAWGRFLEGLEQGVRGAFGEPVGVLDDDDAPGADRRAQTRLLHEGPGVVDLDRQPLGRNQGDIGVRGAEGGAALTAYSAAVLWALQRSRERPRGRGAPAARRPGEQPGVGHGVGAAGGSRQGFDGVLLAHDVVPHGHASHLRDCECLDDPGVQMLRGQRGVQDEVALRVGLGPVEEMPADPFVERVRLRPRLGRAPRRAAGGPHSPARPERP